jgi:hypothetical protein
MDPEPPNPVKPTGHLSRFKKPSALKKIGKSIDRHTRADGRRGYLEFVAGFFAK